ncbi:MAG: SufE family protein, partial [Rhodothermales bacterium]|nr:SufE family protein [Rhodothermales bacterium]
MTVALPDTIEERIEGIVSDFSVFDDWLDRYEYLIELGNSLRPLSEEFKTDLYRVPGCQSQVWLKPDLVEGRIYFEADSDAMITKGLVALLIRVLDGQTPNAVAEARMDFLEQIGRVDEHHVFVGVAVLEVGECSNVGELAA